MRISKQQRINRVYARFNNLGFSASQIDNLLKCERALQRWHERECNGEIVERDGAYWLAYGDFHPRAGEATKFKVPRRDLGAIKRAKAVVDSVGNWQIFVQTDPRGCALYVYRPADLKGRDIESCYSSIGFSCCS